LAAGGDAAAAAGANAAAIDLPGRTPAERRLHQPSRLEDDSAQHLVVELRHAHPRRDARGPERLGLPHVPDPRNESLVEERVADLPRPRARAEVANDCLRVEGKRQNVRPEPANDVGVEVEHGPVPEHAFAPLAAEDEPRPADAAGASRLEPPPPRHPEVTPQDETAVEAEQQVLADGLHGEEPFPVQPLRDPFRSGARVRRLDLYALTHERLQTRRRTPERVSLRHFVHNTSMQGMNIAALARRTGVPPDTLRKWEQRYGVLRPQRTSGGQRRYTELDLARVEWLRARLNEGYRIGDAAALIGDVDIAAGRTPGELRRELYEAVREADVDAIRALLDQTFAVLSLEQSLTRVIAPVLERVGEGWANDELSVAQEHLVSGAIRARLDALLADARGEIRGVAVLACVPGERHELGLLMLGTLLRADGWQVAYVGADAPFEDALELSERLDAAALCLSATMREHVAALKAAEVPRNVTLTLGGGAATPTAARRLRAHYSDGNLRRAVRDLRRAAR
jgi:methanogenic corrinoid protein MtbC1